MRAANLPLRTLWSRMREVDIFLIASAISFSVLLTTIPVLIIFASLVGIVLHSSGIEIQQLPKILDTLFPPQPFATEIKASILRVVTDMVSYRTSLGIVGILALTVTASFVFDIIRTALHRVYRIKGRRRFLVSFLHDILFVLLAMMLLVASNLAIWALNFLRQMLEQRYRLDPVILEGLLQGIPTTVVVLMTTALFYILYAYLTDTRPPWPAAIASTATSTTLWLLSGLLFSTYLESYSLIGTIYGPYAFLLVLLLWTYYSCLVFVFGGIVGEVFWERLRSKEVLTTSG